MLEEGELDYRTKILDIRSRMKVGKNGKVDLGNGKSYDARFIGPVLDAILPELTKARIDVVCVDIVTSDAGPTHWSGVYTYRFTDLESGYSELVKTVGSGADRSDKQTGKATTYAMKYLFTTRFIMDSQDDPDKQGSDVDVKASLTTLKNIMTEMKATGYFMDEEINPEKSEKHGGNIYSKLGQDIANHKNNGPWLMKKEEEMSILLKQYKAKRNL